MQYVVLSFLLLDLLFSMIYSKLFEDFRVLFSNRASCLKMHSLFIVVFDNAFHFSVWFLKSRIS